MLKYHERSGEFQGQVVDSPQYKPQSTNCPVYRLVPVGARWGIVTFTQKPKTRPLGRPITLEVLLPETYATEHEAETAARKLMSLMSQHTPDEAEEVDSDEED